MKSVILLPMAATLALALSGCMAAMAASAVSMAATAAGGHPKSNEEALNECSNRAAQYGAIHIIDVEQHSVGRIIVWGTVDDGKLKRSFECDYGTSITGFKLRTIAHPPQS
jgi:hypothetical protein